MAPMAPVDCSSKAKGKKQANFSNIEIEQIAKSWLACFGCSVTGAQQKSDVYWAKIETHFRKAITDFHAKFPGQIKMVPRSVRSLSSKWSELNHDCAKFTGAMSTIVQLNESGTNEDEQLEKAKALYQQMQKKGLEFSYEGAWRILKDSPKWQVAARVNEKTLERIAKRKAGNVADGTSAVADAGDEHTSEKPSGSPEMVLDRPMGNKKAKQIASLEKKMSRQHQALGDYTNNIAAAMNRKAAAWESVCEIKLFSIDMSTLDREAQEFIKMKREKASRELRKEMSAGSQFVAREQSQSMEDELENVQPPDEPEDPSEVMATIDDNGEKGEEWLPASPVPVHAWFESSTPTTTMQNTDTTGMFAFL